MDIRIADRFGPLLAEAVASGRYASAEDVIHEGLRLVEARERARADLKRSIDDALAEDGEFDEAATDDAVAAKLAALRA
jgi:antitoxin ParD1/3/4